MKILGRILIILTVFAVLAGLMVTVVNAAGVNVGRFGEGNGPGFRQQGNEQGQFLVPQNGGRPERGGDRDGPRGGAGWVFSLTKNLIILAILVAVIAIPKSLIKKSKRKPITASFEAQ